MELSSDTHKVHALVLCGHTHPSCGHTYPSCKNQMGCTHGRLSQCMQKLHAHLSLRRCDTSFRRVARAVMSEYLAIVIWFNLSSSLYSSTVTVGGGGGGGGGGGCSAGIQLDSVQNCYMIMWNAYYQRPDGVIFSWPRSFFPEMDLGHGHETRLRQCSQ